MAIGIGIDGKPGYRMDLHVRQQAIVDFDGRRRSRNNSIRSRQLRGAVKFPVPVIDRFGIVGNERWTGDDRRRGRKNQRGRGKRKRNP